MCDRIGLKLKIPQATETHSPNANRNSPTSSTNHHNPTSTICLDSAGNVEHSDVTALMLDKLNGNLELESMKKQLEVDEMRIQIAMLEEEKAYKSELNKHDLLQKSFDLKKVCEKKNHAFFSPFLQGLTFMKISYVNFI